MTLKLNGTTSGSVSLDAPATGSNISFTLPGSTGSSGQLLSTNGAGVLSFVNGGKILQVVRATDTTNRTTTSTSLVDVTGMSVTITPQKSDSAIILLANALWKTSWASGDDGVGYFSITDSSNNLISGAQSTVVGTFNLSGTGTRQLFGNLSVWGYVSPATTNAVTYKLRFRSNVVATTTESQNGTQTGQMYAIEVAA